MLYCAHAIFYYLYEGQASFPVHENLYLINAPDPATAMQKSASLAREYEQRGDDSRLEISGVRAEYCFAGVRKLIEVAQDDAAPLMLPGSGIEVTYSVFEVEQLADVMRLAEGGRVQVVYQE